ncbi:MAG TPA: hypothetical protein PLD57_13320 [Aggregatilineales bacterium]|nr:hypothetical protein [Aggregatilineales bacterium]
MMLAERLYRLLLHLYPLDYRREYGDLMLTHFRDLLRDAQRSERAFAEEKLILHILLDTLHSAAREHLDAHQVGLAADLRQAKPLPLLTRLLALAPAFLYVLFYSLNEVGVTVPPALIIAAACGVLLVTLWAWIKSLRRGSSIIPGWLMYSAGSLTIVLVFALSRLPTPVGTVVLLALATAGLVVTAMGVHRFRHRYHTPRLAWGLLAALVAVFTASHLPDLLTGILSLPFLGIFYLLPVALGLWLCERHGSAAVLFPGSMICLLAGIDITYWVSLPGPTAYHLFKISWFVLVYLVAPLWVLSAQRESGRTLALLPLALAWGAQTAASIHGTAHYASVGNQLSLVVNGFLVPLLAMGFALVLYRSPAEVEGRPQPPRPGDGAARARDVARTAINNKAPIARGLGMFIQLSVSLNLPQRQSDRTSACGCSR